MTAATPSNAPVLVRLAGQIERVPVPRIDTACCNALMQVNTYSTVGAHIAAKLVNQPALTADWIEELLREHEVHRPRPSAAELAELERWVQRLREVFHAHDLDHKAQLVNALLVASDCRPRLAAHDGLHPHLHYAPMSTSLPARVKAMTAAGLVQVIADGHGPRIRSCDRQGCDQVFVDVSRNGRRRFCSLRCANQVNVANHRMRRRTHPSDDHRNVPKTTDDPRGPQP